MPRHLKPLFHIKDNDLPTSVCGNLGNIKLIETILRDTARRGKSLSYAEMLYHLGYAFSRPKMRALCVALCEVDVRAALKSEPPLAVLVVRASDGLPGAGWWIDKSRSRYKGPFEGPEASAYIRRQQGKAFRYWQLDIGSKKPAPDLDAGFL